MADPRKTAASPVLYRERLWVPWWWWPIGIVIMAGSLEAIFVAGPHFSERGGWPAVIIAFVVSCAIVAALLFWLSAAIVEVRDGTLSAGPHTLPAGHVATVHALDRQQTRALLGPRARHDARLFIRGWLPTAVRIDVTATEGAPYWLVSSRDATALAGALLAAVDPNAAGQSTGRCGGVAP